MIIDIHGHLGNINFARFWQANAPTLERYCDESNTDLLCLSSSRSIMYDVREGNAELDKALKETEKLLDAVNITCNKNSIPNDPTSPFVTSGIRLGSAAVTTRGFTAEDMDVVAEAIHLAVTKKEAGAEEVKALVKGLTDKHPLY